MGELADELERQMSSRMAAQPRAVWTAADFVDLGPRAAVNRTLHQLVRRMRLRRVARGFYDRPAFHHLTAIPKAPDYRAVLDAIARRDRVAMLIDGCTAAKDLGLSDAVSDQIVVQTPARLRPLRVGAVTIRFRLTTPDKLYWAGRPAMRVVQALHWLRETLDQPRDRHRTLRRLRIVLDDPEDGAVLCADLGDGLPVLPAWMQPLVRKLLAPDSDRRKHRAGRDEPIKVTDDWPEMVPITEAELRVMEAHLGDVLDDIFGPLP
jgi:hypothetical protein